MTEILPQSGFIKENIHYFPLRVYYEDTDIGGVVYYANYLKFMERARSEMLRKLGIDQKRMLEYNNLDDVSFVVRHAELDFKGSARYDDCLVITTQVIKLGGASIVMKQNVLKDGTSLVESIIKAAVIGQDGRAKRLPKAIAQKFKL
ncbi:MAG: tol-pal system-associated acyl-CoA thioesterase [Emcibacteraceae bacterium]|nr:tol-pal system-associated acyl-CoA thioesterase [Emcibacteraceae bacterium]